MKFFAIVAIGISGWLILFRSSFPLIVKCLLPFHYFIFYQNGVVSRPYSYMTLALLLMALTFKERNVKPLGFVLSMAFLCMLSGYGIVLAGGVAAAWTIEILIEKKWRIFDRSFWKDKRILELAALLALAILLVLQIMPQTNTFAFSIKRVNPAWVCLLYAFFAMLPDATLLNVLECEGMPKFSAFDTTQFALAVFVGIIFLIAIHLFSTKRNRLYFYIPYVFFSAFTGIVYFSAHHMGIPLIFFVFWFWIAFQDEERGCLFRKLFASVKLSEKDAKSLKTVGIFMALIPLLMPVVWTVVGSFNDIRGDYFASKKEAAFIKEHDLENCTFLVEWGEVIEEDWSEKEFFERVNAYGLDVSVDPVSVLPYFEHNFCLNLNRGNDRFAYATHRFASEEESREEFAWLRAQGAPDAIIGLVDLKTIYGDDASMNDYVPVYKISPRYIGVWKIFKTFGDSFKSRYIYLRKDLLDQYGVEEIEMK
ncbi:MAG: hypothetical protein K6F31_02090 [Acetatifactor sp.]|nr:hypothetical protein [Acetatifactor sp.]